MKLEITKIEKEKNLKKETEQINDGNIKEVIFDKIKDILKMDPLNILGTRKNISIDKNIKSKNKKIIELIDLNNKAKNHLDVIQKQTKIIQKKNNKLETLIKSRIGIA